MRIVLVNWAKIWDGATKGGGVNGYCQSLALSLVRRGHDVAYLSSGTSFVPLSYDGRSETVQPGPVTVCRHPDWLGVKVFEVVNSTVLAPTSRQFRDPLGEVSSPELEARLGEFFGLLQPDVVHFHNIEGFSAGCVERAKASGAAVVYSLHNYHTICSQSYLMQGHRKPCFDFAGGKACETCMEAPDPAAERRDAALQYAREVAGTAGTPSGPSPNVEAVIAPAAPPSWRQIAGLVRERLAGSSGPKVPSAAPEPVSTTTLVALPAEPVTEPGDIESVRNQRHDSRGKTGFVTGELGPPKLPGIGHAEWEPLLNIATPEPFRGDASNAFARRRGEMVRMLSGCDRVLAVSSFVAEKFVALGVNPARVQTQTIGTAVNQAVRKSAELLFDPPAFNPAAPRPIRLVFLGFNSYYKGLHMLLDTLELLTPEYTQRLHMSVYARDGQHWEWRFRRIEPRLGGLTMHHGYEPWDIPWIMGGKDATIVPSVWWDNAPQTVFESFACGVPVIGAELGGIPDFVRHGHNGLLFRGNDRFDLARRLVEIVRNPQLLTELRRNVRPPKDIEDHAQELETLYAGCLPSRSRSEVPPGGSPAAVRVGELVPG